MVQPLWRTVWVFLKKLKIELPYNPAITFLGVYPKKTKTLKIHKMAKVIYMHPYVQHTLFTIAKIWKQLKCPSIDERIKKM